MPQYFRFEARQQPQGRVEPNASKAIAGRVRKMLRVLSMVAFVFRRQLRRSSALDYQDIHRESGEAKLNNTWSAPFLQGLGVAFRVQLPPEGAQTQTRALIQLRGEATFCGNPASRQKITQSPETKQTLLLKALFNRGFFLAPRWVHMI